MKKTFISLIIFSALLISCKKDQLSADTNDCMQIPPAKCSTIHCSSDGKPVCGCNGVTYNSACEAECDGVVSYKYGACKN